jgi:hypothetical protein
MNDNLKINFIFFLIFNYKLKKEDFLLCFLYYFSLLNLGNHKHVRIWDKMEHLEMNK